MEPFTDDQWSAGNRLHGYSRDISQIQNQNYTVSLSFDLATFPLPPHKFGTSPEGGGFRTQAVSQNLVLAMSGGSKPSPYGYYSLLFR